MPKITAKLHCNLKLTYGESGYSTIGFCPDYAQGRNAQWGKATPHLDLRMTVYGDVADEFETGKAYTMTLEAD